MLSRDRRAIQEWQDEDALYRAARAMTVSVFANAEMGMMRGELLGRGLEEYTRI